MATIPDFSFVQLFVLSIMISQLEKLSTEISEPKNVFPLGWKIEL